LGEITQASTGRAVRGYRPGSRPAGTKEVYDDRGPDHHSGDVRQGRGTGGPRDADGVARVRDGGGLIRSFSPEGTIRGGVTLRRPTSWESKASSCRARAFRWGRPSPPSRGVTPARSADRGSSPTVPVARPIGVLPRGCPDTRPEHRPGAGARLGALGGPRTAGRACLTTRPLSRRASAGRHAERRRWVPAARQASSVRDRPPVSSDGPGLRLGAATTVAGFAADAPPTNPARET
jgi:hypothetical protein